MPWKCLQCRELVEDDHEVCWHCGTAQDGSVDASFQHADEFEPPLPPPEKPQFRLASLLKLVTALSFVFGMFSVIAAGRLTFWSAVVFLAGAASLTILIGVAVGSLLATWASRIRRDIRADIHAERERQRRFRVRP